jgi:hypothetical protein
MGPVRGTPFTACVKVGVGGKYFRSVELMLVAML